MEDRLEAGMDAPDFALKNQDGEIVSSQGLRGSAYVLYFYPKDMTKGCTIEAHDFSVALEEFSAAGYKVYGVSSDSEASHKKFIAKEDLGFMLLVDEGHIIAKAYGAYGTKMLYGRAKEGVIRSSFLIDKEGKIALAMYNVRASGHVARLLEKLKKLG